MRLLFVAFAFLFACGETKADTLDSLFQVALGGSKPDYHSVNKLLIALDAEGSADSLYTFDSSSSPEDMRRIAGLFMAYHYYNEGVYAVSADITKKVVGIAEMQQDSIWLSDALANLASCYDRLGMFDLALETALREIHVDSLLNDDYRLSSCYNNLAAICCSAGKTSLACEYIQHAIRYEEKLKEPTKLSVRYGNAAEIFASDGRLDEAMEFAEKAYELDRRDNNQVGTARRMAQMADIYLKRKEYAQAERLYLKALDVLRTAKDKNSVPITLKQLGNLYIKQGKFCQAIEPLEEAEGIVRSTGNKHLLEQIARLLHTAYRTSDPSKSLMYLEESTMLRDSIQSEKLEAKTNELELFHTNQMPSNRFFADRHKMRIMWMAIIGLGVGFLTCLILCIYFAHRLRRMKADEQSRKKNGEEETMDPGEEERLRENIASIRSPLDGLPVREKLFLLDVLDYIHANLQSKRTTIELMADHFCMSRSQFIRRIHNATGDSPNVLVTRVKMEKAVRMLKSTEKTVNEIAALCGYDEPSYFIRVFKQTYEMTPQQFRNLPSPESH